MKYQLDVFVSLQADAETMLTTAMAAKRAGLDVRWQVNPVDLDRLFGQVDPGGPYTLFGFPFIADLTCEPGRCRFLYRVVDGGDVFPGQLGASLGGVP